MAALLLFGSVQALTPAAQAALIHRYPLNTDAKDVVGTANGSAVGGVTFDGSSAILDGVDGYIDLPNGLISSLSNATFEAWVNWTQPDGGTWQRIFDFGSNSNGEDAQGTGTTYLFLSPLGGSGQMRFAITDGGGGAERPVLNAGAELPRNQLSHVAVVYDQANAVARLYLNGRLVSSGAVDIPLSGITDVNNWLGRSNWPDPYFAGSLSEFRIYNSALNDLEIAASAAGGPDAPTTDPGTLQSLALNVDANMILGGVQVPDAVATYSKVPAYHLPAKSAVVTSGSPTIVAVDADGNLNALLAGTAVITATFQGQTATQTITVKLAPPVLKHRYSFKEAAGATLVVDSVSGSNGVPVGGITFDGKQATFDGSTGYIDLPNGMISARTNVTIETWVTWAGPAASNWQRIFDIGSNSAGEDQQGTGQTYLFLSPRNGANGRVRFTITKASGGGEAPVLDSPAALPVGIAQHVAVVYAPQSRSARLFVNGVFVASGTATIPLTSIKDVNVWLGRSNYNDPYFAGSMDEFRIWEGALADEDVAFSFASGPDKTAPIAGDLKSIRLATANPVVTIGAPDPNASLLATYQNLTDVDISGFKGVTFTSSDTTIVRVSATGALRAWLPGSAVITASYKGITATLPVTTALPAARPAPTLIHRYSFTDAVGSATAKDSAGTADGFVLGGATFDGTGHLTLNGTDGYVSLPSGLISDKIALTVEGWATWNGTSVWQRLFDFGNNSNGADQSGTGDNYIFLSPANGATGNLRFGLKNDTAETLDVDAATPFPKGRASHFAVAFDPIAGACRLYVNGVRVGIQPTGDPLSVVQDVNMYIGRSNWPDPFFKGIYDEFRIYNGGLTDAEIDASFKAGPDSLPAPPTTPPALTASWKTGTLTLTWPSTATDAGYYVESTGDISSTGTWLRPTQPVITANGISSMTLTPAGAAAFYRLRN